MNITVHTRLKIMQVYSLLTLFQIHWEDMLPDSNLKMLILQKMYVESFIKQAIQTVNTNSALRFFHSRGQNSTVDIMTF
jgi:hypothetical protein